MHVLKNTLVKVEVLIQLIYSRKEVACTFTEYSKKKSTGICLNCMFLGNIYTLYFYAKGTKPCAHMRIKTLLLPFVVAYIVAVGLCTPKLIHEISWLISESHNN